MGEVVFGSAITLILCFAFTLTLLLAIFSKHRKRFLVAGVVIFIVAMASTCYTVFTTAKKVINKASTVVKPRTGDDIYVALFGKSETDCVKVINYLDQTIPIMDYAIALHFKTCPQELQRILSKRNFSVEKQASSAELIQPGVAITWLRTDALGDSVIVYKALNPDASGQVIYSSLDSTKVMLLDYTN